MLRLLRRLGARLAPPPRSLGTLPPELRRFYEITDGAEVPRLGARLAPARELVESNGRLPFATSPQGAWAVIASGPLRGWIARIPPEERLAFRSVTSLLSAMVRALEEDAPLVDELADPARSEEEQALGAAVVRQALEGNDERWLLLGVDLLGPTQAPWLYRAATHPLASGRARARAQAFGLMPPPLERDLRARVAEALESRGWTVTALDGPHALRVERDGHGSWHTIAPSLDGRCEGGRTDDEGIAARIAERIVRRELQRRTLWRLRRDDEPLETAALADAYAFCRAPWTRLELHLVAEGRRLELRRAQGALTARFESPGGSWTARAADSPLLVRAAVEHMLLRREPLPSLPWAP